MAKQEFKLMHSVSKVDAITHYTVLYIYWPAQKPVFIIKEAQKKGINSFLSRVAHGRERKRV